MPCAVSESVIRGMPRNLAAQATGAASVTIKADANSFLKSIWII